MCQQVIPELDMKLETLVSRLEVNNLDFLPRTNRKVEKFSSCQMLDLCPIDPSDAAPTQ